MRPSLSIHRLAVLALAAVGLILHSPPAEGTVNLITFVNPHTQIPGWSGLPGTIGFCYAGSRFVGSIWTGPTNCLYQCASSGPLSTQTLVGPAYSIPGQANVEHMVAASLGIMGWPDRDIYVAYGIVPGTNDSGIYHIPSPPSTGPAAIWFHIPSPGPLNYVRGLMFDAVGSFEGDMLISTYGGFVYEVGSNQQIKNQWSLAGRESEGMDIAPYGGNFGPAGANYDGDLFVANEFTNSVWVISHDGTVNHELAGVFIPGKPEELSFVPMDLDVNDPVQGFYAADYPDDVVKGAPGQFAPYKGDLIVTSEVNTGNNLYDIHWNGSAFVVTCIGSFPIGNQPEDGVFVTESLITHNWGPCCLPNGQCVVISSESCMALSGTFWAGLTSCTPNPCCTGTCFSPPSCLNSWYPIEETDSDVGATDVLGGSNSHLNWAGAGANLLNDAPCPSSGMSLNLNPPLRYLEAGGSAANDITTGGFSIFAWVKMNNASDGLLHTLVQKMVPNTTVYNQLGYGLDILNGQVRLRMHSGTGFSVYTNPTPITDGVWHLVGATVCRSTETFPPFLASVYLDQNQYSTTTPADMGSLSNGAKLRVGNGCPGLALGQPFDGAVDQLQIYNCCLSPQQVDSLYQRSGCYCTDKIWVPSVVSVSNSVSPSVVTTTLRICNYSAAQQTYTWTAYGLPAGSCVGSYVAGPTIFAPQPQSVTLPASPTSSPPPYCTTISIVITLPPGIKTYERSCYEVAVKNLASGNCYHARGVVRKVPWQMQPLLTPPGMHYVSPLIVAVPETLVPVPFKLWNDSDTLRTIGYELSDHSADEDPANQVVSLNGLPPGAPVVGLATLAPGDSTTLLVNAVLTEFQPLNINEVLLSVDWSGGTQYEPEAVVGLASVTSDQLADVPESPPVAGQITSRSALTASPNPFGGATEIRFSLAQTQASVRIDVFDVGGRLVKALYSGPLSVGSHVYRWNGLDDSGEERREGIYFIRAQAGSTTLTNKVVRLQ